MKLDNKTVAKIAHLARLKVADSEVEKVISDMNSMLTFVDKLKELDTEGVEPLMFMSGEENRFRKDAVGKVLDKAEVLHNAPKHDQEYFRVPKIIEV